MRTIKAKLLQSGFLALFMTQANANVFVIDYTKVNKLPVISVTVKDKNGNDTQISAIVDSGNSDGIVVSKAVADNLGLPDKGAANAEGIGGTSSIKKTEFTGDKALRVNKIKTPTGQTQTTLSISGNGAIIDGLPVDMLLGQDFLDSYVQTFNPKDKKLTLTALDQLSKKPKVQGKIKDIKKVEDNKGTLNIINAIKGPSWTVDAALAFAGGLITPEFTLATGSATSLISEATASSLGIDLSTLTQAPLETALGTIDVWQIALDFQLFPGDPLASTLFGIVPDVYNPGGINALGSDVLDGLGVYQIDIAEQKLRAGGLVASPGTGMLTSIGLLAFLFRKRRGSVFRGSRSNPLRLPGPGYPH